MSRTRSRTQLATRPDDHRSTPAGLVGYLAVLAVGLALLTAPAVVGAGLTVAGLAAVVVSLARGVVRSRAPGRAAGVGADTTVAWTRTAAPPTALRCPLSPCPR